MTKNTVEETLEELTSPTTFNLKNALAKQTSPEESVTIYLDGRTMHEANLLTDEIVDLESEVNTHEREFERALALALDKEFSHSAEANGAMTDDPELEGAKKETAKLRRTHAAEVKRCEKEIAALETRVQEKLATVVESALTFKMRGVIGKQTEMIVAKWNREIKEPARGDYDNETDWQTDFVSRQQLRNRAIVVDQVRTAILSVTDSDGEHPGGWTYAQASDLWDVLETSEKNKLTQLSGNLSFASSLFERVTTEDADFLPKA